MYYLYTDGGARANTHAACAWIITDEDKKILHQNSTYLGATTSNCSEYFALILGLTSALAGGVKELEVYQDSELVSRQMNGQYKVKAEHLKPLYDTAMHLSKQFTVITFNWLPRDTPIISKCDEFCDTVIEQYLKK